LHCCFLWAFFCRSASLELFVPTYTNPIVQEALDLGDPGAVYVDGYYYLATSSGDVPDAYPIHRSADLANWALVGHVFPDWRHSSSAPAWARGDFWAPDLQVVNGRFACYFSASTAGLKPGGKGVMSLGVAFSDNVTGPYADIGKPLWSDRSNTFGTIDVHYHETSAGDKYLLWKKNQDVLRLEFAAHLMIQRLADDGASLRADEPAVAIATADKPWEKWGCVEAPWLIERNGTFYLFYSGSMVTYNSYAVGVARAANVTGPYTKKPEPVIHGCDYKPPAEEARFLSAKAKGEIYWTPGHCSVRPVYGQEDRWVMFYHGRDFQTPNPNRSLMMDELKWGADGWPYVDGDCPSSVAMPLP